MNIYQLFDENEATWYVQAFSSKQAKQYIEETFQVRIENWHHLPNGARDANIHVAWANVPAVA